MGLFFLLPPQILLSNRLDNVNSFKYTAITMPLLLSLATLVCLSFGSKGGNNCKCPAGRLLAHCLVLCDAWVGAGQSLNPERGKFTLKMHLKASALAF